ncbi:hypothetical protein [Methanosarcina horonobensis]|nr:hypothetical protein [Methanosarcina horonobensis]
MELLDRITNTILEATDTFTAPVQVEPAVYAGEKAKDECVEGAQ